MKKNPIIIAIEINKGAKKLGESHPSVGPEVTAKMNKIKAIVKTETPTISRRCNFSLGLRVVAFDSKVGVFEAKGSTIWEGIRKMQAVATGIATIAVKKNTQCQETY
jgi:hypothetical protein